jgi:Ca2+-binding RTX toxin-like protein
MRNTVAVLVLILSLPVCAATVRIEGTGIVFEAANGEKNTVLLEGPVVDDPLGDGFFISDSTIQRINTAGEGCTAAEFGARVVCAGNDPAFPTFVKVKLGDGDDSVTSRAPVRMVVNGGPGNDVITGNAADDDLDGDRGVDTIDGGRGNDIIRGGLGGDTLTGGFGSDEIIGSAGRDTINAQDSTVDTIRCGGGKDTLTKDSNDKTRRCNDR